MIYKKSTFLIQLITILTLTLTIAYTSIRFSSKPNQNLVPYTNLNTAQLQQKVELLANQDKLPFKMGLELIKRWKIESIKREV